LKIAHLVSLFSIRFWLIICLFLPLWSWAQSPHFRHYTTNDGLASSQVYQILQDSKGFLWFATDRGVSRYDGYTFERFDSGDGLVGNVIFRMTEDHLGRVWFCDFNRRLSYFDHGVFRPYAFNNVLADSLQGGLISTMKVEGHLDVWLGIDGHSKTAIAHVDSNGVWASHSEHIDSTASLTVHLFGSGYVCGTNAVKYAPDVTVQVDSFGNIRQSRLFRGGWILRPNFLIRPNGDWFMAGGYNLMRIDKNDSITEVDVPESTFSLFQDKKENIWLGVKAAGVLLFPNGDIEVPPISFLNGTTVTHVLQDNEGGYWFSTDNDGVYYTPELSQLVLTDKDGIPDNRLMTICRKDNEVLLGHASGYISLLGLDGEGRIKSRRSFRTGGEVRLIRTDEHGEIWFSGYVSDSSDNLPKEWNSVGSLFRDFKVLDSMVITNAGTMIKQEGLSEIKGFPQDLIDHRVDAVFGERDGAVLVGTLRGLYRLVGENLDFLGETDSNLNVRIVDIQRLNEQWLAMGTRGKGLILWDGQKSIAVGQEDGLNSDLCNRVYIENDSTIWLSTNAGINCVMLREGTSAHVVGRLDLGDGLISNEVADLTVDDRFVWAVTSQGVSRLLKEEAFRPALQPVIRLIDVKAGGAAIKSGEFLEHWQNQVHFHFVGLSYRWPRSLRYKYRLLGVDSTWEHSAQTSIEYSALSPGDYTFEVNAVNTDFLESNVPERFSFSIATPLWKRWWFVLSVLLLLLLTTFWVVRQRLLLFRERERQKGELEGLKNKVMRVQMRPHFFYNSLNTIQSYIVGNQPENSTKYLSKFSRLMRLNFAYSEYNTISLRQDQEALRLYVELEQMRYPERLRFHFECAVSNEDDLLVPPLLLQPFVENAILHGVLPGQKRGDVWVRIEELEDSLEITIKDNGIGMENAAKIAERKRGSGLLEPKSTSGAKVTHGRIALFNKMANYYFPISEQPVDVSLENPGTQIVFRLHKLNKKK